ncbi:MAG: copper transporter [Dethiobacteria bacterium]|nr:copper transporter [Bacillota bacterium]
MYNIKEYMLAIAAVFLALGIGILVGISLGEDFMLANQKEVIEKLEEELAYKNEQLLAIEEESEHLKTELINWRKMEELFVSTYLKNTLKGKKILVLQGGEGQLGDGLEEFLRLSGAEVGYICLSHLQIGYGEQDDLFTASFVQMLQYEPQGIKGCVNDPEVEEKAIKVLPPEAVLISGDHSLFNNIGKLLVKEKIPVIAVSTSDDLLTEQLKLVEAGCSLIDNIDSFLGKLTLSILLKEYRPGHYGFHEQAHSLFPQGDN